MPAGIQIFNDSNTTQIDSRFDNFFLKSKMTVSLVLSGGGDYRADVDFVGSSPIAFISDSTVEVAITARRFQSGTFSWQFAANSGVTFTLYIFDKTPPTAGNYGLQVFNEAGGLVFDATAGLLKIDRMLSMTSAGSLSLPNTSGRKLAVALSNLTVAAYRTSGPGAAIYSINSACSLSGATFSYGAVRYWLGSLGPNGNYNNIPEGIFVDGNTYAVFADVTGL